MSHPSHTVVYAAQLWTSPHSQLKKRFSGVPCVRLIGVLLYAYVSFVPHSACWLTGHAYETTRLDPAFADCSCLPLQAQSSKVLRLT